MCGAGSGETELGDAQSGFYTELISQYGTEFAENQQILKGLTASLTPIINAGINQQGFSNAELTNLNSQAETGTGQNYAAAKAALANQQGSEGGGTSYIPSGAKDEMQAQLASSAAAESSGLSSSILASDYATGRSNYLSATGALEGVSGLINPEGGANAATGAGSAASTTENNITQANNSWMNLAGAALGAAGSTFTGAGHF